MRDEELHSKLNEIIGLLKEIRDKPPNTPVYPYPWYPQWPPVTPGSPWITYTYQSPPETSGGHQQ